MKPPQTQPSFDHRLLSSLDGLEPVEDALAREVSRLRQALASAHEALKMAGAGAKKDRAVLATMAVLAEARPAQKPGGHRG